MEIKILQVFYGKDGLPYKDKDRQVHFPIAGTGFLGASNTTQIKFYYDELDNLDETTWVAVSKLPNGKVGSRVLESHLDSTLNEHYALLELDSYYTQYKGDVFISLQGYQGGVNLDYNEETSLYEIHGTPTIAATGSIKFTINYANQFVGSGETDNVNFQRILADLGTKLGMRAYSEHVEELPSIGQSDIFYVVNDDPNDPNLQNIYIWNENTKHYVWVGDNTLDLKDYYTKDEANAFESSIDNRVTSVENELESVASGSPKGVYATVSALESAYPTGTSGIFVVTETGYWYYWDGTQWASGGVYLSNDYGEEIEHLANTEYEIAHSLPYEWEEEDNFTDDEGYYWLSDGTKQPNAQCIACKCPVEFGKLYSISAWTNYDTTWAIRFLKRDGTTQLLTDYSASQPIVDYVVTPTKDTVALLITHLASVPAITIKKTKFLTSQSAEDVANYVEKTVLNGTSETVSGSYYETYEHNFEVGKQYLIELVDSATPNSYTDFYGLVDKTDTSNTSWQFHLKKGQGILWTPTKDFEALYWGIAGTFTVKVTYQDSYLSNVSKVFYCGANRELSTLKAGIEKATEQMDSILYVDDGVYDLIEEFGADYFTNLSAIDTMSGLKLMNRIHIIFSSNSVVKCHYTGSNQYVMSLFSPFNAGPNGFILENLNLECSNVRYAIHDERNGATEQCISKYRNCKFSIDNSQNSYWSSSTCIGGGLGSNHQVEIQNCVFKAVSSQRITCYYHDSNDNTNTDYASSLVIKDNYFINGTIGLDFSRQDATNDKYIMISNNNVPPVAGADTNGMVTENMTGNKINYYCWGNIIRTGADSVLENIAGTLRHLLSSNENIDFENTNYVDLGSISWSYDSGNTYFYANISSIGMELPNNNNTAAKALSPKYKTISASGVMYTATNNVVGFTSDGYIVIRDTNYTDATSFKNALKGIIMAFEKASA